METDYQNRYINHTFRGKRKDEEIILILRRHWLILAFTFFPLLFFLGIIFALNLFQPVISDFLPTIVTSDAYDLVLNFMLMFWWLLVFIVWIDYYLDVWIVTDQRIINMEQQGLFHREVSELEHSKIQDVTTEVKGVIPTLIKFGYVYIQTAGEKSRFIFKQVPNPVKVKNVIMQLQKQAIQEEIKQEGEILRGK